MRITGQPVWANNEQTQILLMVGMPDLGVVEFIADPNDCVERGRELYARALAGEFGTILPFSANLPTLYDVVAAKHAQINAWRDQQELTTVAHNGYRWDADPTSRARIESVLLAGAMPLDYWTDADNVDRPMTLEQLRALYAAIVQQGGRIHDRQRQMKAEVAALTTIDAVQAYPIGWPDEAGA
jgi:hypothetical protein